MKLWIPGALLCFAFVCASAQQSGPANDKTMLVESLSITGTRSVDTAELNDIKGEVAGVKVSDGEEEIRERIRLGFQERGYFDAKVNSLQVKTLDPLANPRPVSVEAVVEDGPVYRIGKIEFTGNRAVSSDELRSKFAIKANQVFRRSEIASGLTGLRDAYVKLGFISFYSIPDAPKAADQKVNIEITVVEGPQFHMGKLEFRGDPQAAEKLRPRWNLEQGAVYDATYLKTFWDENQSLFPPDFDLESSTAVVRNCRDNTVTVIVDLDPKHPSQRPNDEGCDSADAPK